MKWYHLLISIIVSIAVGFVIGTISHRNEPIYRDVVKVDTLYHIDTITEIKPIYKELRVVDSIKVTVHDTIDHYISLPREEKVYEDSSYRAVVSGYEPSLDSISVFATEKTIYRDRVEYIPKIKRWGVGLQVGYGMGVNGSKVITSPYIGIGIQYNIIAW